MKIFQKICFLALALLFSGRLAAQEIMQTDNNLLPYYDTELFQWSYSIFGGLTLNYRNQSSIAMYGIKDAMKDALLHYDDTNQRYRSYRSKTIVGNALVWSGLGIVLAGGLLPFYGGTDDVHLKITTGVMLGGLVTEIIGAFVLKSGQENIFDAVNIYNRRKISEYK
ncbi:MAG: hypothetical protein LBU16_03820 [Treponema sp.]|jgi:hypothetical protein|nr:hypothetical protein [Treponema sp.]